MKHAELAAQLDAAADRLTRKVLAAMYTDPFWHERFGERADRHGQKDGRFHIDYLIQALHAGDPTILENYARWLQPVLTSRGMSTRHLADNFALLAGAIRDEAWRDGDAAIRLLDGARAALEYPHAPARDIQRAAPALAAVAADVLAARSADRTPWRAVTGEASRARCVDELVTLALYVADAIALADPAVFTRHAVWLAGFLDRHQVPRGYLIDCLEALAAAAGRALGPAVLPALRGVIDPALAELARLAP